MPNRDPQDVSYRERLWAPVSWWLLGAFFAASVWVAYQAPLGPSVSIPVTVVLVLLIAAGIVWYGLVEVSVYSSGFRAGRAKLPAWAIGEVEVLDAAKASTARGRDLDPRAYTVIRGYVPTAVRVVVADDGDPVPYWLIATRHPERLAAALLAARSSARPHDS